MWISAAASALAGAKSVSLCPDPWDGSAGPIRFPLSGIHTPGGSPGLGCSRGVTAMHDEDIPATAVTRPDRLPGPIETNVDRVDGRAVDAETDRAITGVTGR